MSRGGGSGVRIAPSILSCHFAELGAQVRAVEAAGAEWIHVDVMDGHFVPTITMGPLIAEAVRGVAKGVMDVHLMVEDPERFVGDFVRCGADMITVHVEASRHLHRALRSIRECGARAGVALNPSTPVTAVEEVLEEMDMVVVMSVNPGFGGQEFIPRSVDKVARVREMIDSCRPGGIEIEVDGGVDVSTAPALVEAGATVLVAGSAVFRHEGGASAGFDAIRCAVDRCPDGVGGEGDV